ncbi:glycosyltransferase [Labrys monachus]|uniref:Glycosyltransferase involved in cell wall biosynthesis n=1 Tax=Labrys monachus TaxID=217067 RepID=A0ABU0FD84_9HYPH|nr:glycosyltransferase [Labrys monachus]MDQ0392545.1 glycosyltransferase involved in cell wall biosynthesis [Labrys monachus]
MELDSEPQALKRGSIVIVTPVFNDWSAFEQVLVQLGAIGGLEPYGVEIIAVDDGSSQRAQRNLADSISNTIRGLKILRLACNLGHQRAIAVGLVAALQVPDMEAVVVMDSDGEDLPNDVPKLISAWRKQPDSIVVAQRGLRQESLMFRAFYAAYKLAFKLLTGQTINFGNFSLLPRRAVVALTHNSAIWNNLAAAISRSRIPYVRLQLDRGRRLAGRSHMNFVSLALHGISAISVYAEVALVRMIVFACIICGITLAAGLVVVAVRLGTDLAVPGWASYVMASLAVIFLQALVLGAISVFQLLNTRILKAFIPAVDATIFVVGEKDDHRLPHATSDTP